MFKPNISCRVHRSSGASDVYGQPLPTTIINERCAVINLDLKSLRTTVRADSSASRGAASEEVLNAFLLMTKNTQVQIDDVVEVTGIKIRVMRKFPRHSLKGVLDHYEIGGTIWSEE